MPGVMLLKCSSEVNPGNKGGLCVQALPLCRYSEVMELAVGRLMDKSINAVKSAIQLLAAFIAHNPYSCKVILTNMI